MDFTIVNQKNKTVAFAIIGILMCSVLNQFDSSYKGAYLCPGRGIASDHPKFNSDSWTGASSLIKTDFKV